MSKVKSMSFSAVAAVVLALSSHSAFATFYQCYACKSGIATTDCSTPGTTCCVSASLQIAASATQAPVKAPQVFGALPDGAPVGGAKSAQCTTVPKPIIKNALGQ